MRSASKRGLRASSSTPISQRSPQDGDLLRETTAHGAGARRDGELSQDLAVEPRGEDAPRLEPPQRHSLEPCRGADLAVHGRIDPVEEIRGAVLLSQQQQASSPVGSTTTSDPARWLCENRRSLPEGPRPLHSPVGWQRIGHCRTVDTVFHEYLPFRHRTHVLNAVTLLPKHTATVHDRRRLAVKATIVPREPEGRSRRPPRRSAAFRARRSRTRRSRDAHPSQRTPAPFDALTGQRRDTRQRRIRALGHTRKSQGGHVQARARSSSVGPARATACPTKPRVPGGRLIAGPDRVSSGTAGGSTTRSPVGLRAPRVRHLPSSFRQLDGACAHARVAALKLLACGLALSFQI